MPKRYKGKKRDINKKIITFYICNLLQITLNFKSEFASMNAVL